jgi:hypothetical protein
LSYWRTLGNRKEAPVAAGIYVLIEDGQAVYVGQSRDLRHRLSCHMPPEGTVIKVKTSRRYGDWLMDELRLIRRLRPRRNVRLGSDDWIHPVDRGTGQIPRSPEATIPAVALKVKSGRRPRRRRRERAKAE